MRDCDICYESRINFKTLSCSHSMCMSCFKKINKTCCPFCRKPFTKEEILDHLPAKIKNKTEAPILNYNIPFSRVSRNQYRKRRKNLSFKQVLERRQMIRKRMKKKWTRKDFHLNRIVY